jgi:hypothetical protein
MAWRPVHRAIDEHLAIEASGAQQRVSRISGRLVAPSTMMPSRESNPSISTSS